MTPMWACGRDTTCRRFLDDFHPAVPAHGAFYLGFRHLKLHLRRLLTEAYSRTSATVALGLDVSTSSITSTALLYFTACIASKIPGGSMLG